MLLAKPQEEALQLCAWKVAGEGSSTIWCSLQAPREAPGPHSELSSKL